MCSAILPHDCSAMRQCLESAVGSSKIPDWDFGSRVTQAVALPPEVVKERKNDSLLLSMYFLFFFVVRHSVGHTLVQIPYDALGQELTTAPADRERLFAWKSLSNFAGLMSAYTG